MLYSILATVVAIEVEVFLKIVLPIEFHLLTWTISFEMKTKPCKLWLSRSRHKSASLGWGLLNPSQLFTPLTEKFGNCIPEIRKFNNKYIESMKISRLLPDISVARYKLSTLVYTQVNANIAKCKFILHVKDLNVKMCQVLCKNYVRDFL